MPDPHPMDFKGGISLSKVYTLIDRLSEDVDVSRPANIRNGGIVS